MPMIAAIVFSALLTILFTSAFPTVFAIGLGVFTFLCLVDEQRHAGGH
jgi:hypothetical protein